MIKKLKAYFTNRANRPRIIIWSGALVIVFMLVFASAQMLTSYSWFCNQPCHIVHADNAVAYAHGTHDKISCIACHYPVQMNAVAFAVDRADKLVDLPPTIMNTYEKPVNEFSHLALVMESEQCTQCHAIEDRKVTPRKNLIIDHKAHADKEITCTTCHNRVAHKEDFELTIPGNKKHEIFSTMTACFRCHTTPDGVKYNAKESAPGACKTCHAAGFDPKPASHEATGWAEKGHVAAADKAAEHAIEVRGEWAKFKPKFDAKEPRILAKIAGINEPLTQHIPPVGTIYECSTCHTKKSCDDCHAKAGVTAELKGWEYAPIK